MDYAGIMRGLLMDYSFMMASLFPEQSAEAGIVPVLACAESAKKEIAKIKNTKNIKTGSFLNLFIFMVIFVHYTSFKKINWDSQRH